MVVRCFGGVVVAPGRSTAAMARGASLASRRPRRPPRTFRRPVPRREHEDCPDRARSREVGPPWRPKPAPANRAPAKRSRPGESATTDVRRRTQTHLGPRRQRRATGRTRRAGHTGHRRRPIPRLTEDNDRFPPRRLRVGPPPRRPRRLPRTFRRPVPRAGNMRTAPTVPGPAARDTPDTGGGQSPASPKRIDFHDRYYTSVHRRDGASASLASRSVTPRLVEVA